MLPFLKKNMSSGMMTTSVRKPDTSKEDEGGKSDTDGIEYCAQDLIDAVRSGDKQAAARALKDAFEILESQPHEEYDHNEQESE